MKTTVALLVAFAACAPLRAGDSGVELLLQRADELSSTRIRQSDQSIPLYDKVLVHARSARDRNLEARATLGLGRALLHVHQQDAAETTLRRSLTLARQLDLPAIEAECLVTLAGAAAERGDIEEETRLIDELVQLGSRYLPARLRGLNFRIAHLRRRGKTGEAINLGRLALRELDAAIAAGKSYPATLDFQIPYNLGRALIDAGEAREGTTLMERAFAGAEQQGLLAGEWHVLHDLGELHSLTGDPDAAQRYYLRALEIARQIDSRDPEAITLRGLGAVAEARADLETAEHYYTQSVALLDRAGVENDLPMSLIALSRVLVRQGGETNRSRELIERAVTFATRTRDFQSLANAQLELGRQGEQRDNLSQARRSYHSALQAARGNGLQVLVPAIWNGLASTERRAGNRAAALKAYEAAADAVDAVRARIPSPQQRISFVATTHDIYQGWIETLLQDRAATADAYHVLERERSRNLLDRIAPGDPDDSAAAEVRQLQIRLASEGVSVETRRNLLRKLEDAERRLDLVQTSRGNDENVPPLVSLQRSLEPGELFAAYTPNAEGALIFVVRRNEVRAIPIKVANLEGLAEIFNRALAESDRESALRSGAALWSALIQPLQLDSSVRHLIIAPSGGLAGLPFGAVPDPATKRPLIERRVVSFTSSLSTLAMSRSARQPGAPRELLAVAPLGSLPATVEEIKTISRLFKRADLIVGAAATEPAVRETRLNEYGIVHFASHAVLNPRFPERSAIEFSRQTPGDDGKLQIREIRRLKLAGQLVVLSACDTASGRASAAEGMQSLSRAFTQAGARTVVGTLWRVEDRAASKLIEGMYRRLRNGDSAASALREAQLTMAGRDPYGNAGQWAPWVAMGDAGSHRVADPPRMRYAMVPAFVGVAMLLLAGALIAARHRRGYSP